MVARPRLLDPYRGAMPAVDEALDDVGATSRSTRLHGRRPDATSPAQLRVRFATAGRPAFNDLNGRCGNRPLPPSGIDEGMDDGSMRVVRTISTVAVLLLTALAGCGGDGDDRQRVKEVTPVDGTFVGKVDGTGALVAVVVSPAERGQKRRETAVYVCDGKRLCEWFSGSATAKGFRAGADEGDGEAAGELTPKTASGTIELSAGKTLRYKAERATAAAGLYDLTVSSGGELTGVSAAGVGLEGKSPIPRPGSGSLKLADGKRLKLDVTRSSVGGSIPLRAGQVRVIVLPDHQLSGAARSRRTSRGSRLDFFIRSATG